MAPIFVSGQTINTRRRIFLAEEDGSPSFPITKIEVPNGSLTEDGAGVGSIDFLPGILDDPNNNVQITAAQCNGVTIITNDGSSAGRTYILPKPAAGLICMVYLEEAQDVNLDPNSPAEQIYVLTDSGGDEISSDATAGSCIKLIAHDATGWWPYGRTGAWADAN